MESKHYESGDEAQRLIEFTPTHEDTREITTAQFKQLLDAPLILLRNPDNTEQIDMMSLIKSTLSNTSMDNRAFKELEEWHLFDGHPTELHQSLFSNPLSYRFLRCYGEGIDSLAKYEQKATRFQKQLFNKITPVNRLLSGLMAGTSIFTIIYAYYFLFHTRSTMFKSGSDDAYRDIVNKINHLTSNNAQTLTQYCNALGANLLNQQILASKLDFCLNPMLSATLIPSNMSFKFSASYFTDEMLNDGAPLLTVAISVLGAFQCLPACLKKQGRALDETLAMATIGMCLASIGLWLFSYFSWEGFGTPYSTAAACMDVCNHSSIDPSKYDFVDIDHGAIKLQRVLHPILQGSLFIGILGLNRLATYFMQQNLNRLNEFKKQYQDSVKRYYSTATPVQLAPEIKLDDEVIPIAEGP